MRGHLVLATAVGLGLSGQAVADDLVRVKTGKTVTEAMDALQGAAEGAGATVFARVDHGAGAASVGMELGAAQLLIFGNPKLGTPVMQADPLAGLYLPLKVLAYADANGQVWLAYEDPEEMLDDLDIDDDAEAIGKMRGALEALTAKAAE